MVALQHFEGTQRQQPVERPHLDTGLAQAVPEAAAGADGAERVVEHARPHASARALAQRVGEAATGVVVADDVVLEVDPAPCRRDVGEHRREGGRAVGILLERVPRDWAGARRAVDGEVELVGHPAGAPPPAPPRPRAASTGRRA